MFGDEIVEIKLLIEEKFYYQKQNIPLNIVYEDNYIIIINKSSNLVMHPGAGIKNGTILNALLYYFPPIINIPRAGIIHRLDKDTTGLVIIAKTQLAQTRLVESLRIREIIREYEAIVFGNMISGGIINQPIARHITKRTRMSVHQFGKSAITHYRIIERFNNYTHIRIRLETGRTHQIRTHMEYINHPIVGDPIYGKKLSFLYKKFDDKKNYFNRQMLHASFLKFYHPITLDKMKLHAPLPKDMIMLINILKKNKICNKIH